MPPATRAMVSLPAARNKQKRPDRNLCRVVVVENTGIEPVTSCINFARQFFCFYKNRAVLYSEYGSVKIRQMEIVLAISIMSRSMVLCMDSATLTS